MRRMRNKRRQLVVWTLIACMTVGSVGIFCKMDSKAASVTIDGELADWESIPAQGSADASVPMWKVAQDKDFIYFCGQDKNGTDWYRPLTQQTVIFSYANGSATGENGNKAQTGLSVNGDEVKVIDAWYQQISGATAVCKTLAGTSMDANMERAYEWSIPKSFLADTNYALKFCGTEIAGTDIPSLDGSSTEPEGDKENPSEGDKKEDGDKPSEGEESKPSYQGIVIDGQFQDWDAIQKTAVTGNTGDNTLDEVAMVWDGDTVYLYFMAKGNDDGTGNWSSVTWSGPNSNGKFAITTDLGNTLLVQLVNENGKPAVAGVDGAKVAVNNQDWTGAPHMWEVSIPASALPAYKETVSFGFYQVDPFVKDMANLQGNPDTGDKDFNGIVIDGLYGDWTNYPHTLIQYATPGTGDSKPDGEAALYTNDGTLYAHVKTEMQAHRQEAGGEFTQGINVRLNGNENYTFMPQIVAVDAQGNIDYNPRLSGLTQGTYEFYMIDATGWKTATNISELDSKGNGLYGHMYVTVGASADDTEFEMDMSKLADKFGLDKDDIHKAEIQWQRIGQQWVTTAGTSTGAWLGLLLCFAAVGVAYVIQVKRKKTV
ncbi:MAG: Firmicu-CTERM sorting domain-containing protein [Pararoseburia sp.]|nr:hypothetical protein [Lachnospiraceae bacterium]MDY4792768.1 Firmicu-CTERM sorting domain-containing protein [Pararoseburia sp.]